MNTDTRTEIRFTAKSALVWNNGNHRWTKINHDTARELISTDQAVELKAGEWI